MIASLVGKVQEAFDGQIVLEVGDIGYAIHVPRTISSSAKIGTKLTLYTSMVVREESISLYGFTSGRDKTLFEHLLSVSGVGPKLAVGIMSDLSVEQISHAVQMEDDGAFRSVSGIGSKTAKLIILSLAGKLPANNPAVAIGSTGNTLTALTSLGWSEREAKEALASLSSEELSDSERLKKALRQLNRTNRQ